MRILLPRAIARRLPLDDREPMARFLIVDDHPLFCAALTILLRLVDAKADIHEAHSIESALGVLDAHGEFGLFCSTCPYRTRQAFLG